MKQHITVKQLNELSEKGKERLRKKWKPKAGDMAHFIPEGGLKAETFILTLRLKEIWNKEIQKALPLLSIGQMIEFLDKRWRDVFFYHNYVSGKENFCDDLWQATKEILEK